MSCQKKACPVAFFVGSVAFYVTDASVFGLRIGGHFSESRQIENGVPQGAVISPLLFNVMSMDLPTPPPP